MKNLIALAGAGLLIIGCFFPVMSVPDRTFTLFDPLPITVPGIPENSLQYAGVSIMSIAVLSIILTLTNKTRFLWISGITAGAILLCIYFGFHAKLDEMKAQADEQMNSLFGGIFQGITDSLFQAVELGGTGWYVISSGALLLLTSSFVKRNNNQIN